MWQYIVRLFNFVSAFAVSALHKYYGVKGRMKSLKMEKLKEYLSQAPDFYTLVGRNKFRIYEVIENVLESKTS